MRKINLIIILTLLLQNLIFGQSASRYSNPNYMWTTLDENFAGTSLTPGVWEPMAHYKRGLGFLVNSPNTINVANGNLELKMQYAPNYLDSTWHTTGWLHVYSNYIGGEVTTLKTFHYGVFECRAKYAKKPGSWPAFWIIGNDGISCPPGGYGNEIDIAEMFSNDPYPQMNHIIHRYYPPLNCDDSNSDIKDASRYLVDMNESYATYKCIWTPFKIEYYINDNLRHSVNNTGQEWYPSLHLNLKLSQQVCQPTNMLGQEISPVAPQTSYFDYVKVKEFFLAPEITVPSQICATGAATMDVDTLASNVTWQITPSNLVVTSSGTGLTANITASPAASGTGTGTIIYTFSMPSGETFTASKSFWIGLKASFTGNSTVLEGGTGNWTGTATCGTPPYNYEWFLREDDGSGLSGVLVGSGSTLHLWSVPRSTNTAMVSSESSEPNITQPINNTIYYLYLRASDANNRVYYTQEKQIVAYGDVDLINPIESMAFTENQKEKTSQLKISPNPASDETTIEIYDNGLQEPDINTAWQVEVYDAMQSLKIKAPKVKGTKYLLNTRGWKESVYLVRVKRGSEIFSGKLAVKP